MLSFWLCFQKWKTFSVTVICNLLQLNIMCMACITKVFCVLPNRKHIQALSFLEITARKFWQE